MAIRSLICLAVALSAQTARAAYSVVAADFTPTTFFSKFDFYTDTDPTSGFVEYVDEATASSNGYISTPATDSAPVYIGTDHSSVTSTGRRSIRIESKQTFQHGLYVLDVTHMPVGCGTWPAFWMYGKGVTWPANGEIDIMEHVNQQQFNNMALHTSDGCTVENTWGMGTIESTSCVSPGTTNNEGCSVHTTNTNTFGAGFNSNGGGVWVTEVASTYVRIWFFPRGSVPSDVLGATPEPNNWGTPRVSFEGSCDFDSHIGPQTIVFNTDFCGTWAGNIWSSSKRSVNATATVAHSLNNKAAANVWAADSTCASLADTCQDYVANNPTAFADAYWTINSLKIFSQ